MPLRRVLPAVVVPLEQRLGAEAQQALDELDAGAASAPDPEERIRELLAERAVALARADAYALRATSVGTPQQARDRRWTRRLRGAPLAQVRYLEAEVDVKGSHATARALMVYRVRGIPRGFATLRQIELEGPTTWRVVRDRGIDERLHWEVAPFGLRQSRHVVLLTAPGAQSPGLLRTLEAGYLQIARTLPGRPLPSRVLAVAVRTTRQGRLLTSFFDGSVAAIDDTTIFYGPPPARAARRVLSQRLIIDAPFWRKRPGREQRTMLAHEMVHAALDRDTSARMPAWLSEGLAMYFSGDVFRGTDLAAEGALAATLGGTRVADLCDPRAIARRRGSRQADAYVVATAAVAAIVRRHGRQAVLRLHDAFRDEEIPGGPCRATRAALRETLGMTVAELDRAVAAG